MQTTTRFILATLALIFTSLNVQAQACDCVCSGANGLPDPLPIPGLADATECTNACTTAMYASGTFIFGNCLCNGAPANPPDPTEPIEATDAQQCNDVCTFLNYTNNTCTPVPVEMTYFKASMQNEQILLRWETASEIDNAGFEVERSGDGINWQLIDYIKGNGTSIETQQYKWLDTAPLAGVNYYRLKQMDINAKFEYSKIVSISLNDAKPSDLLVWPNPATESISFQLINADAYDGADFSIHNGMGQLVRVVRPDNFSTRLNQGTIRLDDLSAGIYILNIRQGNSVISKHFIKR